MKRPPPFGLENVAMTEYDGRIYMATPQIWVVEGTLPDLTFELRVSSTATVSSTVECLKVGPHPDGPSLYAVVNNSLVRLLLADIAKQTTHDPWTVVASMADITCLAFLPDGH
jgi:hypothetical protein